VIIAVNTRFLLKDRLEGIGRFSYEVLKRIVINHPEHQFYFIFDRPYSEEFIFAKNVTPVVIFPPARHAFLFIWWFELSIPRVLKRIKPDLFLSPDGYLSLRTSVPSCQVIHDLNFEHFPEYIPFMARKHYLHYFPKYARKAKHIITVSEYTKKDITNLYKIPAEKITVAYNGISGFFSPCNADEITQTQKEYTGGNPFFLFVGSLHPRKNIGNLMTAFDAFRKKTNASVKLLIAGQAYWWNKDMEKTYQNMQFREDVIFTGRIDNPTLRKLYGSALALTYVSLFEGFGLPIAEAMQCHTPVICSNTTSMPEVGGDAALYADPLSADSICDAMLKVYHEPGLRKQMVEKGIKQVEKFNWDHTEESVWKCIQLGAESTV